MNNITEIQKQLIKSTNNPEVEKLVWNHLFHSIQIQLNESQERYSNNKATSYMLSRQLEVVNKYYKSTYGEFPATGERVELIRQARHEYQMPYKKHWASQQAFKTTNSKRRILQQDGTYLPAKSEKRRQEAKKIIVSLLRKGMNQKQISKYLGISQGMVSSWGLGKLTMARHHVEKLQKGGLLERNVA
tara:strand:- start:433 stop:996 length:564 start_codon:yes stop_codon:yes gene_type:complete